MQIMINMSIKANNYDKKVSILLNFTYQFNINVSNN